LQLASGLKVTNKKKSETGNSEEVLMILTNRYQRIMTDTLNVNETNFRILTMDITQIQDETNCFASCSDDHKP